QASMPSGAVSSAPSPPMPPALATAAASPTGQAPAIGAIRIGTCNPKRRQNSAARSRAMLIVDAVFIIHLVLLVVRHPDEGRDPHPPLDTGPRRYDELGGTDLSSENVISGAERAKRRFRAAWFSSPCRWRCAAARRRRQRRRAASSAGSVRRERRS